ncbi:MAG: antibiotic biosynthesis monooxygenase family protein [Candidatus Binatia bacterium]
MVVRIFWGKLMLGKWDEYERYYNETVVPNTAKMKGFRGRQLLRSKEDPDEGISLTFWETNQDLENYVKSPERQKGAREAENLYTGEYWVKHFEVKSLSLLSLGNV